MALLPTKAKPFSQPNPLATTSGGTAKHPSRNLGKFLHPPRPRSKQATTMAPKPPERTYVPADGDYKPAAKMKKSPAVKTGQVGNQAFTSSDANTEALGSMMGPASLTNPPTSMKTKRVKTSQKIPFFGNM